MHPYTISCKILVLLSFLNPPPPFFLKNDLRDLKDILSELLRELATEQCLCTCMQNMHVLRTWALVEDYVIGGEHSNKD